MILVEFFFFSPCSSLLISEMMEMYAFLIIQWNLSITVNLGTNKKWLLYRGGLFIIIIFKIMEF